MKTAISIPDKLFAAAEREAKRRGVSRSKLYQEALEKLIANRRDDEVSAALTRSYTASPEPDDPFMERIAARTMARVEWNDEKGRDLVGGRGGAKRLRTRVSKTRSDRVGK
jgi:hypothetical protein